MSSDIDPVPTGTEKRARARGEIDIDREILNDNITAAIAASERLHWAAKRKLQEQGLAPAASSGELTEDDLHQLAVGLVGWLGPVLKDVETRLAAIEANALRDGGVWDAKSQYRKGCVTTHGGNLWLAKQDNSNSRPPSDHWRLMNKTKAHL
jgi:hypothetical protein